MAKMTVEFDTETKTFTAAVDGRAVPDVRYAEVRPSWDKDDEYRCSFVTSSKDESTGISEIRQLCASGTGPAKAALASGAGRASEDFPGFVEVPSPAENQAVRAVAALFGYKG